jgi:ribosomal-protein-alanine N-acetyltransferase
MKEAIAICKEKEVRLMTLEVRMTNITAQNLYRKLGFQDGGIRKNYYTDDHEDALVMWVEFK